MIPTERVPQMLAEERDLGAAQERDKWRTEVERMIEEEDKILTNEPEMRHDELCAGYAISALKELLRNMEAKHGKV